MRLGNNIESTERHKHNDIIMPVDNDIEKVGVMSKHLKNSNVKLIFVLTPIYLLSSGYSFSIN